MPFRYQPEVVEAIENLVAPRSGANARAILSYIEANHPRMKISMPQLKQALDLGLETGVLGKHPINKYSFVVVPKSRRKAAPPASPAKSPAKAKRAAAAAAKKPAAKARAAAKPSPKRAKAPPPKPKAKAPAKPKAKAKAAAGAGSSVAPGAKVDRVAAASAVGRLSRARTLVVDLATAVNPASQLDPAKTKVYVDDDDVIYDAMLTLVELPKHDKFYHLQVLADDRGFVSFTHWGRSGTSGQTKTTRFASAEDAVESFTAKFHEKTGQKWEDREPGTRKRSKYAYLKTRFVSKQGKWQWYLDKPQDGLQPGWHDYVSSASKILEDVFEMMQANPTLNLGIRHVQSGRWMYRVDLKGLTQTNLEHPAHTTRKIRRV